MQSAIDFSLLDVNGEILPVFSEEQYKIIGMYQWDQSASSQVEMSETAFDQILIPAGSVEASDGNNIVAAGPMHRATTTFQIPNGSIAIAMLLLYFFVVKQKKSTAIERSLGMNKNQCRISMTGGLTLLVFTAALTGSIASFTLVHSKMDLKAGEKEVCYSREYSNQKADPDETVSGIDAMALSRADLGMMAVIPVCYTLFVLMMAVYLVNRQFRTELLVLLGDRES